MFEPKDFDYLHKYKIKYDNDDIPLSAQYFFCYHNKMLFIKKSKRFYKLIASCQCGFEPIYRESSLDVIYYNTDLLEVIKMFFSYCLRLIPLKEAADVLR